MFFELPLIVRLIITVHVLAFIGFCFYGLLGLEPKEEHPPKARQIAVVFVYIMVVAFVGLFLNYTFTDIEESDSYKEDMQESYDDGYYAGYDEGYQDGYESGSEEGYIEGYESCIDDYDLEDSE